MHVKLLLMGVTLGISTLSAAAGVPEDQESNGLTSSKASSETLDEKNEDNKENAFAIAAREIIAGYKAGTKTHRDLKDFQSCVYGLIDEGQVNTAAEVFKNVAPIFYELFANTKDTTI